MAERALTAGMASAVQAAVVRPAIFFEGEFSAAGSPDTQYLRLWTGVGNISWDGKLWSGAGKLLGISPIEESARIEAVGFTVTLSGMPSDQISLALQSIEQGRPGKIWLAAMDSDGSLIADPYLQQQGRFDIVMIEDNGSTCTIQAQYESRLVDLLKPRTRRYTVEDQKIDYPNDTGFHKVAALQDIQLIWGGPGAASAPLAQATLAAWMTANPMSSDDSARRPREPSD